MMRKIIILSRNPKLKIFFTKCFNNTDIYLVKVCRFVFTSQYVVVEQNYFKYELRYIECALMFNFHIWVSESSLSFSDAKILFSSKIVLWQHLIFWGWVSWEIEGHSKVVHQLLFSHLSNSWELVQSFSKQTRRGQDHHFNNELRFWKSYNQISLC